MEPVSIITSVLVRALSAPAERLASDAYEALKEALLARYGKPVAASLERLEREPTSSLQQQELAEALRNAGAGADPSLVALADELARQVEDPYRIPPQPDPMERIQHQAGLQAVETVMEAHLERLLAARRQYPVKDSELLTANVGRSRNIPQQVQHELTGLHAQMRNIVERVAEKIETAKYRQSEQAIQELPVSLVERERAVKLISADKQLHVSYQTLRTVVEFVGEFNQNMLARIENEASPAALSNMMLGNAIMLYELADFVISYNSSFAMAGVNEIDDLYVAIKDKFDEVRQEAQTLEELANGPKVSPETREQALLDIRSRQGAIEESEREWANYVNEVRAVTRNVDELRAKMIPDLEVIRANAKAQISVIQLVALLRILRQNSEAVKGTVAALQGFRLAPLTSNRVQRLLSL